MATKTCGACGGSGGFPSTQRVHNPAGGMFQVIHTRETCSMCGGSGSVYAPDPVGPSSGGTGGTHGVVTMGADGKLQTKTTPEEADRNFAALLAFLTAGFMGYLAFFKGLEANVWVKGGLTLVPAGFVYWYFNKYRKVTRVLRIGTGIVILLVIVYYVIELWRQYG